MHFVFREGHSALSKALKATLSGLLKAVKAFKVFKAFASSKQETQSISKYGGFPLKFLDILK